MFRKSLFAVLLLILSVGAAQAAGFEPGATIRAVEKNGEELSGTIVKFENDPEIALLDKSGHYFKLKMKDVTRISAVAGEKVMTGGGTALQVLSFDLVDGQSVSGGLNRHSIVKVDLKARGQRNVWLTDYAKYEFVEVVDRGAAPGEGKMKVRLIDGRIINVPVKKSEVHSIVFE